MKQKILFTLRYDESLIATIKPQFLLQYSKSIFFSVLIVCAAVFLCYPLWKIGAVTFFLWIAMVILGVAIYIRAAILYANSAAYLTNQRLIDVDRPQLLRKEVNEYPLSMIQEVRYHSTGLRSILANAGTVVVIPVNDRGHIELRYIQKPEKIKELILRTCKRHLEEQSQDEL